MLTGTNPKSRSAAPSTNRQVPQIEYTDHHVEVPIHKQAGSMSVWVPLAKEEVQKRMPVFENAHNATDASWVKGFRV